MGGVIFEQRAATTFMKRMGVVIPCRFMERRKLVKGSRKKIEKEMRLK